MAGASNCATFCFLANPIAKSVPATPHRFRLKPLLVSSTATPFPSQRTKRKNQLRQKILKTLTKPFPTAPLPQIEAAIPAAPPPGQDTVFQLPFDGIPSILETDKTEELRSSESIGEQGGIVGKISAKSVLKYAWYVVGVLLVQTICVVWFLDGSSSDERKARKLISLDGKEKVFLDKDGKVVYFDDSRLEERINEIRAMAREARDSEKENLNEEDEESEIEKEIGARLLRLEKRLESKKDKFPGSMMDYLGWFGSGDDELSESASSSKEDNDALMFKKRFKFKNSSVEPRSDSPKGFPGSKKGSGSGGVRGSDADGAGRLNGFGSVKKDGGRKVKDAQLNSVKAAGNDLEKESEIFPEKLSSGTVWETTQGKSSIDLKQPYESRNMETYNSAVSKLEDQAAKKLNKPASQSSFDSVPGKRSIAKKIGDKQSVHTDLWWLNLQYVFAILMHRDGEHEVREGLYSLRIFEEDNLENSAYTLAFEDRGDANNFCCLLESFFEDLGDFSADIVTLSVKEAYDEVRSQSKEMLVIKKRQLKLYAGQPFEEVEMALRSLIEQNQNTS